MLDVELQQVVLRKARDKSAAADAAMGAVMIVGMELWEQSVGALLGMMVGPCVSPFTQRGLDEAFGLAVGARGVRTGKDVPHPAAAASPPDSRAGCEASCYSRSRWAAGSFRHPLQTRWSLRTAGLISPAMREHERRDAGNFAGSFRQP